MPVSYDVVNLYCSVPDDKVINVLINTLNNDKEQRKEPKKSTLTVTHKLRELYIVVKVNAYMI